MSRVVIVCLLILTLANVYGQPTDDAARSVEQSLSRSVCVSQLDTARILRGRELLDVTSDASDVMSALPNDQRRFQINVDESARIETALATVTAYRIEPTAADVSPTGPAQGDLPLFIIRHRTVETEMLWRVDVEATDGESVSVVVFTDLATGSSVSFDISNASVSCPKTKNCLVDCALNKLCSSLTPCQVGLMTVKVADCVFGTKAGCLAVAQTLIEAVLCMGIDCAYDCGLSSGCVHSECKKGVKLSKGCSSCAKKVCAEDPYCCSTEWDSACVKRAKKLCGNLCN